MLILKITKTLFATLMLALALTGCATTSINVIVTDGGKKAVCKDGSCDMPLTREDSNDASIHHRYDPTDKISDLEEEELVIPDRPPLPKLPTFTEEEKRDRSLVEARLVDHIINLRKHIIKFYGEVEVCEKKYRQKNGLEW